MKTLKIYYALQRQRNTYIQIHTKLHLKVLADLGSYGSEIHLKIQNVVVFSNPIPTLVVQKLAIQFFRQKQEKYGSSMWAEEIKESRTQLPTHVP